MSLTRRRFVTWACAGAGAAVLPSWDGPARAAGSPARPPNVVLIISDDQGWTDYGFMGHKVIRTPCLDKLASRSVVFSRGYVTTALCAPSLGTLLTGLYPHQHGQTGNDPESPKGQTEKMRQRWVDRIASLPRVPDLLGKAGYLGFQTGKWWWQHYTKGGFTHGMMESGRHGSAISLEIGRKTMQPIYDFIDMAQKEAKPFFLWHAPFMPHLPHTPPARVLEKYKDHGKNGAYFAMCEWLDETCGQLLDYLDRKGLAENTLVLFLADNGWNQGVTEPIRGHKLSPYEMGVRTPILVSWPGHVQPRLDKETLVSSVDIAPTVLRACGLTPPREMPGLNLLDAQALAARPAIFCEAFTHNMPDIDQPAKGLVARVSIEGPRKLLLHGSASKTPGKTELFNVNSDPFEKDDLADKEKDRVAVMTKRIDDWWLAK
ncbi:MAG: sulfatase-like hydrolase/transferase [Planctomycetes bacterium]|nr:sulfatase-like hydrolase/transferase [Planctomycetota bacterium]